jgi:hypothetical protein
MVGFVISKGATLDAGFYAEASRTLFYGDEELSLLVISDNSAFQRKKVRT